MREPIVPQLDAEEFLRWEARQSSKFELHHGFVVAFAGGSADHDTIGFNVRSALNRLFPAPCRTFGADLKIRVGAAQFFYGVVGVVCMHLDAAATFVESPRVAVEVLSPSTRAYDMVEKRAAYRGLTSLEWYVIVHTDMRRLEIDSRLRDGTWTTVTADDGAGFLGDRMLPLDDVYERSSLTN
jgi:Uma2 family endonuclease